MPLIFRSFYQKVIPMQEVFKRLTLLGVMVLALFGGAFIYQQGDANRMLAVSIGSFLHAGWASLTGSAIVGIFLCMTVGLLPNRVYELKLGRLLKLLVKKDTWHWCFVGVPGAVYITVLALAITIIQPLPAAVSSVVGQMAYVFVMALVSDRDLLKEIAKGLVLTLVGAVIGIATTNLNAAGVTFVPVNPLLGMTVCLVLAAAGASIMWQLDTVGKMGRASSVIAAITVSWISGSLAAAAMIALIAPIFGVPRIVPAEDWPGIDQWWVYAGAVYGIGIITIAAVAGPILKSVKYGVAVVAGYVVTGLIHSILDHPTLLIAGMGAVSCGVIVWGVIVTMKLRAVVALRRSV